MRQSLDRRAPLLWAAVLLPITLVLTSCSAAQQSPPTVNGVATRSIVFRPFGASSPIQHIVIMVQENRTPDNLFQGVPGADIATEGLNAMGQMVPLMPISLAAPYDLPHGHIHFLTDYDGGKLDGFDVGLNKKEYNHGGAFGYAPLSEVQPYYDMATQYAFADRMFQSNQAGSFPAHQYLVSGTASALPTTPFNVQSNGFSDTTLKHPGPMGCDAPSSDVVETINPYNGNQGPLVYPCFERPVLSDLLDAQGVSWRYYQHKLGTGIWHAMDAIKHVRYGPDYANVITPPEAILTDVAAGNLPGLSWVMPADDKHSDHSGSDGAGGPSWVAAVVNAIGTSQYWNSTAIFITWDDWGGWYDHVPPQQFGNYYELGFRVPLVIISPYTPQGYVSHVQHEFGSILAFSEETFGIPKGSLNTTDVRADDLMDAFDFSQQPRTFTPIAAPPFIPAGAGRDREDP